MELKAANDRLVIAAIGGERYPVLLFARDIPGYWVRVWRNVDGAPQVADGGAPASGGFMFWRTGQGAARRLLVGTW